MPHFSIKAASISGKELKMDVWITEPQQQFFSDEGNVALQMIWDALKTDERKKQPLGKAVSMDDILNGDWVLANEAGYIAAVGIAQTKNYPSPAKHAGKTGKDFEKFWKDKSAIPYASYTITVTDPKWLKHIRKGQEWTSSAIDYGMM